VTSFIELTYSNLKDAKSLVKFVRKRDPRYKLYLQSQSESNSLSPPIPSTVVKAQQKPLETYIEQDWQRVDAKGLHNDLDWATAEGDDLEEWECVACRKTFRSEAAWDSHERSKRHMKEVERLTKDMQADDQDLDLNGESEDEAIYTNEPLLARRSSSINLVSEAPRSVPPLLPQSVNDSDNSIKVPHTVEEEDLKANEISDRRSRAKTRKQTLDFLVRTSDTEITMASNEDDIHLFSSAESPISQEKSKRDKRRARQTKKANDFSVWMTGLSAIQLSDQHLLATMQLLCSGFHKQNPIIQPHFGDWPCSFPPRRAKTAEGEKETSLEKLGLRVIHLLVFNVL
jgi:DnaJ homolog subfamily A member 5